MPDLRPRAPTTAAKPNAQALADAIGTRVHVDIVIPRTDVRGKMRLCSRREELEANAEARATMLEAGYPVNGEALTAPGAHQQWLVEVAVRMLQRAVRDPANVDRELAMIEEWRECDDQQILALWSRYQDLTNELDPLAGDTLTDAQVSEITAAAKKKDGERLMACGSRSLALFAITSVELLSSSATPTSSSGSSPS